MRSEFERDCSQAVPGVASGSQSIGLASTIPVAIAHWLTCDCLHCWPIAIVSIVFEIAWSARDHLQQICSIQALMKRQSTALYL